MIGSRRRGSCFGLYGFRRTSLALLLFGAVALPAHLAGAEGFQTDSIRVEKPTLKAGAAQRFEIRSESRGGSAKKPVRLKVVLKFKRIVQEAKPDGSLTLVLRYESIHYFYNDAEKDSPSRMPVVTLTRVATGLFKASARSGDKQEAGNGFGTQNLLDITEHLLPSTPVHVNDHWMFLQTNGPTQFQGQATLASIDKTAKGQILKISFTAESTPGKTPCKGWLTVNQATGAILQFVEHEHSGTAKKPEDTDTVLRALSDDPKHDPK